MEGSGDKSIKIVVKWSGKEYPLEVAENDSVLDLKCAIQASTGVRPERQKLLNLKHKAKPASDDCRISALALKCGFKLMMMGSLEQDIVDVASKPADLPDVVNDLDIEDEEVALENQEIYLSKIEKRIREYTVKEFNPPRDQKKLLVLDIDYTLFDHRSAAETGAELMRPFLHEFLTSAYEHFDIVIWSATSMKWIDEKMKLLGVTNHPDYKILFHLDSSAMISVHLPKYGLQDVKPLGVIWGKYPQYSGKNTIMFDDIRRNFLMNPRNGLRIRPFRQAHLNRDKDCELMNLAKYLKDLAENCGDFASLDHRYWESYNPKQRRRR